MRRNNRWYDKHPKLAGLLEGLRCIEGSELDAIISAVMKAIKLITPNLLESYVLDFPLDIKRRRWYDRDPYLWLIFNGLRYANKKLLTAITILLEDSLARGNGGTHPPCIGGRKRYILKDKKKTAGRNLSHIRRIR